MERIKCSELSEVDDLINEGWIPFSQTFGAYGSPDSGVLYIWLYLPRVTQEEFDEARESSMRLGIPIWEGVDRHR